MKVAIVHDYIMAFGGAERVLMELANMYPSAPIYTAFVAPGSEGERMFADRLIVQSPWSFAIKRFNLHSPLRFLMKWIWGSLDLSEYDLIITSCSGYFARGFKKGNAKLLAYCHTPPRFLYGYETSIDWQKYWVVKFFYGTIVNHFLRFFDFESAQEIDRVLVNSKNVKARVAKYWRKDSVVVYPPVAVKEIGKAAESVKVGDYYLIASRLVGAKGLLEAIKAINKTGRKLKIVGGASGYTKIKEEIEKMGGDKIEILGRLDDQELYRLYAGARGFIALAKQEDFGMTVVEAMAAGTPVIAYRGGGFLESVVDNLNGVFVESTTEEVLEEAFIKIEKKRWNRGEIKRSVEHFSIARFRRELKKEVAKLMEGNHA